MPKRLLAAVLLAALIGFACNSLDVLTSPSAPSSAGNGNGNGNGGRWNCDQWPTYWSGEYDGQVSSVSGFRAEVSIF